MSTYEILSLIIGTGIVTLIFTTIFKIGKISEKIDTMTSDIQSLKISVHSIDMRLTKLEGRFEERGYWETREWKKTGTEDKR